MTVVSAVLSQYTHVTDDDDKPCSNRKQFHFDSIFVQYIIRHKVKLGIIGSEFRCEICIFIHNVYLKRGETRYQYRISPLSGLRMENNSFDWHCDI